MRADPAGGRCDRVAVNAHAAGLDTQRDVALKRKGLSGEVEGGCMRVKVCRCERTCRIPFEKNIVRKGGTSVQNTRDTGEIHTSPASRSTQTLPSSNRCTLQRDGDTESEASVKRVQNSDNCDDDTDGAAMEEAAGAVLDEADKDECVRDDDGGGGAIADSEIANGESTPPVARLRTLE